MYSNFKKEYTLTQHSIMIHFQAEAENSSNNKFVCLRASEVKPKLDRFIVKSLGGKDKVKEEFIQAENTNGIDIALKYKLVITRNSDKHIIYRTKLGKNDNPEYELPNIFFANMGDNTVKKYGIFFTDGLKVTVKCFNDELLKIIDEHIGDFFVVTNFGTMQDKGFGSFTVDKEDNNISTNKIIELLAKNYSSGRCYKISKNKNNSDFDTIKQVYSDLKKSSPIIKIMMQSVESDLVDKDNTDKINRCPSPIFFKIINNNIYMCANKLNQNMFDKIVKHCKSLPQKKNRAKPLNITIEDCKKFDIANFLEEFKNNNFKMIKGK